MKIAAVRALVNQLSATLLGHTFNFIVSHDKKLGPLGRIFIQVEYTAPCTKTGNIEPWKGGKHYLSEYMTEDEIVKKCYVAFEQAVKHEVMEGFKFGGVIVFNPHVDFRQLLTISHHEVKCT